MTDQKTERLEEALLDLLMHLSEILATDWDKEHPVPEESIKRRIAAAMHRSLKIRI